MLSFLFIHWKRRSSFSARSTLSRFPNFALPKLDTAGRKEPFLSAAAVESGVNPLANSGAGNFQPLGGFAFCKMLVASVDGCAAI